MCDLRSGALTGGHSPDDFVLLLQEVSPRSLTGWLHVFFGAVRSTPGRERGNAILSTLPLAGTRVIPLPRERQPRSAVVAKIQVDGVDLLLVNVHLENRASWWRGALPGDRIRARQMAALLVQLPDGPGVLGGDLNVWFGARERAYQAAAARFPDALGSQPDPTFRERLALDHLFFRLPGGWQAIRHIEARRYGSDHHPVVGVLVTR